MAGLIIINCPGINSKRPYGGRTAFTFDMAEILEISCNKDGDGYPELEEDMEKTLEKLHYEDMMTALQVFYTMHLSRWEDIIKYQPTWLFGRENHNAMWI